MQVVLNHFPLTMSDSTAAFCLLGIVFTIGLLLSFGFATAVTGLGRAICARFGIPYEVFGLFVLVVVIIANRQQQR